MDGKGWLWHQDLNPLGGAWGVDGELVDWLGWLLKSTRRRDFDGRGASASAGSSLFTPLSQASMFSFGCALQPKDSLTRDPNQGPPEQGKHFKNC